MKLKLLYACTLLITAQATAGDTTEDDPFAACFLSESESDSPFLKPTTSQVECPELNIDSSTTPFQNPIRAPYDLHETAFTGSTGAPALVTAIASVGAGLQKKRKFAQAVVAAASSARTQGGLIEINRQQYEQLLQQDSTSKSRGSRTCQVANCSRLLACRKTYHDHLQAHLGTHKFCCSVSGCTSSFRSEKNCKRHEKDHYVELLCECCNKVMTRGNAGRHLTSAIHTTRSDFFKRHHGKDPVLIKQTKNESPTPERPAKIRRTSHTDAPSTATSQRGEN